MIVLYYMLDTARVNAKTIWCIKNGIDYYKLKSYNLGCDAAKTLAMPHVIRREVNGLGLMVQAATKFVSSHCFCSTRT